MADEKELVLGNKQLVSFFFVVLALCGVFFALGYMIGRNSTKAIVAGLEATPVSQASDGQRTQESEPPRETAQAEPPAPAVTPDATPGSAPVTPPSAPQTQPARDAAQQQAPAPKPAAATPRDAGQLIAPEPGATYLQVGALHRADAETMVKTLREQNYPAVLATSSKPDFFRVLVGPYHQTAEVADAKARLKTLGFADAFVLK